MLKKVLAMFMLVCMLLTFSSFTVASDTACDSVDEAIVSISGGISTYVAEDSEMISVASAQKIDCDVESTGYGFCSSCGAWTHYKSVVCKYGLHNELASCRICGGLLF